MPHGARRAGYRPRRAQRRPPRSHAPGHRRPQSVCRWVGTRPDGDRPIRSPQGALERRYRTRRGQRQQRIRRRRSSLPLPHRDGRSLADVGSNLEFVNEAPSARETESEALSGREAVPHGSVDVRNARSFVTRNNTDTTFAVMLDNTESDLAPLCINDNIACNFGDRGGDEGQVAAGKPDLCRQCASLLARIDYVRNTINRNPYLLMRHGQSPRSFAQSADRAPPQNRARWRCRQASILVEPWQRRRRAEGQPRPFLHHAAWLSAQFRAAF